MRKLRLLATLPFLGATSSLLAQANSDSADAAKGCAVCGGGIVFFIVVILGVIALNIALLVWVARDAKSRGMDSSVLWMILVMATGILGLVIYLFSRPKGNLIQCAHCQNKRLQASAKCPHCGNA
jgi:hypothetical protein